jgi:hypothetical protein
MIASKGLGRKAMKASWLATCMGSALTSCCSMAYCQADPNGVPLTKEQLAKNEAESKLWHETMEKFNGLIKEKKWRETDAPDRKTPFIKLYSLKEVLPKADNEVPVFVDVLTECISAAIEPVGTEKSESKLVYDEENKRLAVVASKPQHQLVASILKRLNKTTNAVGGKLGERPKAEIQLQSLLKLYPTADVDKDGWLTQQEVRELFPDADTDGDGKVTPVEARNYLAKQKN